MGVDDVMLGCPGGYGCASEGAQAHAHGRSLPADILLAGIGMLTACYLVDKITILVMVRNNFSGTARTGAGALLAIAHPSNGMIHPPTR